MFKLFRQYNKILMVVLGSMLMVAFLIDPTASALLPSQAGRVVGTYGDGQEITAGEQARFHRQIQLLGDFWPALGLTLPEDPITWQLMLADAQRMGLQASGVEVEHMLNLMALGDPAERAQLLSRINMTEEELRDMLGNWLITQRYRELVYGLGHLGIDERMQQISQAMMMMQFGWAQDPQTALAGARGQLRVSEPLLAHFLHEQQAQVRVTMLPVPAQQQLDEVQEPDPQLVQELYQDYRDDLPGQSEPYGFGYKQPRGLKLAYLTLPQEQLIEQVDVSYADAVDWYEKNKQLFETQPEDADVPGPPVEATVQPFDQVQDQVFRRLREERAYEFGRRIARYGMALLLEEARQLPSEGGYRVLGEEFSPMSLDELAQQLQTQFGVSPRVERIDDRFLSPEELVGLPGISRATLSEQEGANFATYALSVRELQPEDATQMSPLATLRLQAQLPSEPLIGPDGSWYLFRVLEARPARVPELDQVRDRVAQDARLLQAYRQLTAQREQWLERAQTQRLEEIAQELGVTPIAPEPFTLRQRSQRGTFAAQTIEGVGQSEDFIRQLALLISQVEQAGGIDAPARQRMAAIPVDGQLSLMLVRLEDFQPMARRDYLRMAAFPGAPGWVYQSMAAGAEDDPLSPEAIMERMNYHAVEGEEETDAAE